MEYIMTKKFTLDDINEHLALRIQREMLEEIRKKEEERIIGEEYPLYREKQLEKYKNEVQEFTSKLDPFYEKLSEVFESNSYESIQQRSIDDVLDICRFPNIVAEKYVLSVDKDSTTVRKFLDAYRELCGISISFMRMSEYLNDALEHIIMKDEAGDKCKNILFADLTENEDDIFIDLKTYIKLREELTMESIIDKRSAQGFCLKEYIKKSMDEHGFFVYVPFTEDYIYILSASPLLFKEK